MKKLSLPLLSETVLNRRKELHLTQEQVAAACNINRSLLSRLESGNFTPSVDQLQALSEVLHFSMEDVMAEDPASVPADLPSEAEDPAVPRCRIAVAGTGYVGLSLAVLLAQHNDVTAVDIVPEKVDMLNRYQSPIQDDYIEAFLSEAKAGRRDLHLTATTDGAAAYRNADFVIVAAPTNYDPKQNFFDCSAVEAVIRLVEESTAHRAKRPAIVIKSTIPVGYTAHVSEKLGMNNIIFSPEFLRESKALYDNLYPSRIIVGRSKENDAAARTFAALLQQGAIKRPIDTLFMGTTEAEAVKLFANTYLALRVSYFNELDTYAEKVGS